MRFKSTIWWRQVKFHHIEVCACPVRNTRKSRVNSLVNRRMVPKYTYFHAAAALLSRFQKLSLVEFSRQGGRGSDVETAFATARAGRIIQI